MDDQRFDRLARVLGRRQAVTVATGGLAGALGLGVAETDAKKRKKGKKGKKKSCKPQSVAQTCAGACGQVANNCGTMISCGACTCASGCPACQVCDTGTGSCVVAANGTACEDGNACTQTDTCQDGVCVGRDPVVCPPAPNECQITGSCDPATGVCSDPTKKANGTLCDTDSVCCNGSCCAGCCGSDGTCGACVAFVTASYVSGHGIGGLSGADKICNEYVAQAGLPGIYQAWLSDSVDSPKTRFRCTLDRCSMRGYIRTDGVMVATSWSDLTGGRLTTPISRTEFNDGQPFPPTVVWTHTKTDGTREDGDQSCRNWSGEYAGTSGDRGDLQNSGSGWTELETLDCQTEARLYCFQQR